MLSSEDCWTLHKPPPSSCGTQWFAFLLHLPSFSWTRGRLRLCIDDCLLLGCRPQTFAPSTCWIPQPNQSEVLFLIYISKKSRMLCEHAHRLPLCMQTSVWAEWPAPIRAVRVEFDWGRCSLWVCVGVCVSVWVRACERQKMQLCCKSHFMRLWFLYLLWQPREYLLLRNAYETFTFCSLLRELIPNWVAFLYNTLHVAGCSWLLYKWSSFSLPFLYSHHPSWKWNLDWRVSI